ncbi:MAG TPA: nuclear transport factor 2 family protein [Gemmatimonadaceae bacterium]|nr:nuclear transport factor 2 family protein [Gemmatimonadaceae bacterium]
MRAMLKVLTLAVVASATAADAAVAQGGFVGPASADLVRTILAQDKQLFDAVFETCDPAAASRLVADDFEFYHDKFGQTVDSGPVWVKQLGEMCERQRVGTDYRARRELDTASSQVFPMNKYGALHTGVHRFYKKLANGKEQLVEESRFADLWKLENGTWKLTRVLSYDHRDLR